MVGIVAMAKCSGDEKEPVVKASGESEVAVIYVLEGGAVYCGDNQ
jgi:hypothetical protein